jgi:DNA repair photolyase
MSSIASWYQKRAPEISTINSKSIIHQFTVRGHKGLTINPYQGCQHRCAYCYATYEWSPKFYDKIYAKANAPEILAKQLKSLKLHSALPVMISSATDAYQPAEIRFNLTRRCIEILQKHQIPYYVFTKSIIILRDLYLHKNYKDKCCLIWSITTCNEKIRRLVEPGTPPTKTIFKIIKRFSEAGVCCGVNIDPILPLITDSEEKLESIIDFCVLSGVKYVHASILRLRLDIWERMKFVIQDLGIDHGISEYQDKIYQFKLPLNPKRSLVASEYYSFKVMQKLKDILVKNGILFEFPSLINSTKHKLYDNTYTSNYYTGQQTLAQYL